MSSRACAFTSLPRCKARILTACRA
ncbi:hypothetical protein ABIC38_005356 [Variovorax sp. 1126]